MRDKILPETFTTLDESIYAGFWRRFGAFWLDLLIMLPIIFIFQSINNIGRVYYYYTLIPNLLFAMVYHIYFVKRWGGTPGKLITKIKIVRKDGENVGWKEAFLRHVVSLVITIIGGIFTGLALTKMSDQEFLSLSFMERSMRMAALSPLFFKFFTWANNIWTWSEFSCPAVQ